MPRFVPWTDEQAAEVAECVRAQKEAAERAAELGRQIDQRRRDLEERRAAAAALRRADPAVPPQQASVGSDRELQAAE